MITLDLGPTDKAGADTLSLRLTPPEAREVIRQLQFFTEGGVDDSPGVVDVD